MDEERFDAEHMCAKSYTHGELTPDQMYRCCEWCHNYRYGNGLQRHIGVYGNDSCDYCLVCFWEGKQ